MKVSESWLQEWVNTSLNDTALAEKLTMAGLEVDEISPVSGAFSGVVVAHVIATEPHPEADRLTVCQVDAGDDAPVQIVCGATNVRKDLKVALAKCGAVLPGDFKIKEAKLRGMPSQGMICSSSELGLEATSEGILELPNDAPIGTPLEAYLSLDDKVLSIELTPNRADCFSMLGVAREVSALTNEKLDIPSVTSINPASEKTWGVVIDADKACPGYALRLIEGIDKHAETPLWMKERLRRAGIRPINPAVDVTQYVMLEFGQPMHAFDAKRVSGDVRVRFSKEGEQIVLLDDSAVTLAADVLLIADDEKPLAIAGVMGGKSSAVDDKTTDVLLESAFFSPQHIAGVARAHRLCTDASQRFERGVDPKLHPKMIERATELLMSIAGGKPGPVTWQHVADYAPDVHIAFNPNQVAKLTGLEVSTDIMQTMLTALGMQVEVQNAELWQVAVPSHRFDVRIEADLVEEIARLYGFDKLEPQKSSGDLMKGEVDTFFVASNHVANSLVHRGFSEIISYSFVDADVQSVFFPDAAALKLVNPISKDLSDMRVSLWPGLISALVYNFSRRQDVLKCFEVGTVFALDGKTLTERAKVAALLTGTQGELNWADQNRAYDFYDLKGEVEALAASVGKTLVFKPEAHAALHPGKSARVYTEDGHPVGWLGALHPSLSESLGLELRDDIVLFELDLDVFASPKHVRCQSVSKYPDVRRDLSLLMDKAVLASELETLVKKTIETQTDTLKSFDIFDYYMGEQVPEGKKSLAIAMTFQAQDRTLTEQDITPVVDALIQVLESTLNIQVRE